MLTHRHWQRPVISWFQRTRTPFERHCLSPAPLKHGIVRDLTAPLQPQGALQAGSGAQRVLDQTRTLQDIAIGLLVYYICLDKSPTLEAERLFWHHSIFDTYFYIFLLHTLNPYSNKLTCTITCSSCDTPPVVATSCDKTPAIQLLALQSRQGHADAPTFVGGIHLVVARPWTL